MELWFGKSAQHAWDDFEAWATDNQDEQKAHASDSEESDEEKAEAANAEGEAEDSPTIHAGENGENGDTKKGA